LDDCARAQKSEVAEPESCLIEMITKEQLDEQYAYFERHYRATGWILRPGDRVMLGDKANRRCRFCDGSEPDVTFRMEAHAIPESVGNKSLFTYYECDRCNRYFGQSCENDFGFWSLPTRTVGRISGKDGKPSIKQGPGNTWRLDEYPTGLKTNADGEEGFFTDDPVKKTLTFHIKRGPYRPAKVAQAFFKMALSVMSESELPNFRLLLDWMRPGAVQKMAAPTPVMHTFAAGGFPNDILRVALLTRLSDDIAAPYCYFILGYGNETFQISIPSTERDGQHYGSKMTIRVFPISSDIRIMENCTTKSLTLYSDEVVKDEVVDITLSYQGTEDPNR
jgi:hypothetical protein